MKFLTTTPNELFAGHQRRETRSVARQKRARARIVFFRWEGAQFPWKIPEIRRVCLWEADQPPNVFRCYKRRQAWVDTERREHKVNHNY